MGYQAANKNRRSGEMVNAKDLKSFTLKGVRVRVPPPTPRPKYQKYGQALIDYILISIGREELTSNKIYDRLISEYGEVQIRTFYRRLKLLINEGKIITTRKYNWNYYRLSKTVKVRQ